jgi:hypothetical protein
VLTVERSRSRSVVTHAGSVAPLRLLAPANPWRAAWVYQSTLGGGFVGRDAVEVAAGARTYSRWADEPARRYTLLKDCEVRN